MPFQCSVHAMALFDVVGRSAFYRATPHWVSRSCCLNIADSQVSGLIEYFCTLACFLFTYLNDVEYIPGDSHLIIAFISEKDDGIH